LKPVALCINQKKTARAATDPTEPSTNRIPGELNELPASVPPGKGTGMSDANSRGPEETKSQPEVKVYSLSTCSHCKAAKKFLGECTIKYEFVDVDMLEGDERRAIIEDVKKFNPRCSFPTVIIGDKVIVGYKEKEIK
jgi:glutaredoxin-like protein NrdH